MVVFAPNVALHPAHTGVRTARAAPQAPKGRAAHVGTRARGFATFHTSATCRHMTSGARPSLTLGRRLHDPHRLAEGRTEDARGHTLEGG